MTAIGETTLNDAYDALPECRAEVRIGVHVIPKAVTSGAMRVREETSQGSIDATEMNLRLLSKDEDNRFKLDIGRQIEIKTAGTDQWVRYRIIGRKQTAGIIMLQMEALYE